MTVDQLLQLGLAIIGTLIMVIGNRAAGDLHRLTQAVETLNGNMAKIAERVDSHEKRLDKIEEKI